MATVKIMAAVAAVAAAAVVGLRILRGAASGHSLACAKEAYGGPNGPVLLYSRQNHHHGYRENIEWALSVTDSWNSIEMVI